MNKRRFFEGEGYRVLTAENLTRAREQLSKETPGAILCPKRKPHDKRRADI